MSPPSSRLALAVVPFLAALSACGGDGGVEPAPQPPVITVSGVADGAVVEGPVTITISVDVGAYSAELNGEAFFSGTTVSAPGDYVLTVEASHAGRTSTARVAFRIEPPPGGILTVRLFDLGDNDAGGGGDAILLTDSTEAGLRHMMVDAGPAGPGGSDLDFVADRLAALGVDTLQALLLTHAHSDHFGGMEDILREIEVVGFYYNGQVRDFFRYEDVVDLARARAQAVVIPDQVVDLVLGVTSATRVRVLPPLAAYLALDDANSSQINEGSLGARVDRGAFSIFLTGDGEVEANLRWRTQFEDLSEDVVALKVGHHGANDAVFDSGFGGSSTWLEHTDPELQVITANGTSHPRIAALDLLLGRTSARTYCTNVHGEIEIRVDVAGAYTVRVERNAEMDCAPGDDATT